MKDERVLLGKSTSNVSKLSVAIANELHNHGKAIIRSIGQPAGYQTLKAIAAAEKFPFFINKTIYTRISFELVEDKKNKGKVITSLRFECKVGDKDDNSN